MGRRGTARSALTGGPMRAGDGAASGATAELCSGLLASRFLAGHAAGCSWRSVSPPRSFSLTSPGSRRWRNGWRGAALPAPKRCRASQRLLCQLMALIAEHGGGVIASRVTGCWRCGRRTTRTRAWPRDVSAGRCALAMQTALHGYQTLDGLRLWLRIGVGAGEVMDSALVGSVGAGSCCCPAHPWFRAPWPNSRPHGVRWWSLPTPGSWPKTPVPASGCPKAACG